MTAGTARRNWTREESVLALNLYLTIPFGQMHQGNRLVRELASLIGRAPSAVALKLSNFARLDPDLQARGIRGMAHGSMADAEIWGEFIQNREALAFEGERLRSERTGRPIADTVDLRDIPGEIEGRDREAIVRVRVNQSVFRRMILTRYEGRCCITGLAVERLLVASHIVPWAEAPELRLNPRNGLCLNALHDRAFDLGLMTITDDFRVALSPEIRDADPLGADYLLRFDGAPLRLSSRFSPDVALLDRHRARFSAA